MAELVTILAAYTSIVLTIILAVLGFMLYHFVPVKVRVSTMWHDLYNGAGSGHIEASDDERDAIMNMLETAEEQREEVVVYLSDLSEYLKEPDGSEAPQLIDDNYVEDREN
jgi:hypothetical protein